MTATQQRYTLQPSATPNHWIASDTLIGIDIEFEDHKFNETQKVSHSKPLPKEWTAQQAANELSHALRLLGDWLRDNHYDKVF